PPAVPVLPARMRSSGAHVAACRPRRRLHPRGKAGMSEPLLQIREAAKTFHVGSSEVKALKGVNLSVGKGETVAIVGESGSGKTTLANLILGIEKPSAGEIVLAGRPLSGRRSKADRRQIGLVQQNPYSTLNPRKSIGQAIGLPLSVHNVCRRSERRRRIGE